MNSSLHLVPGRYKLPTAPGGSLRKDSRGWEKAENKFTATSGLPACVCPVLPPYMHVCVPVCRVCHSKPDKGLNYYYYVTWNSSALEDVCTSALFPPLQVH